MQLRYGRNDYGWAPWHGPSQWANGKQNQFILSSNWTLRRMVLCTLFDPGQIYYISFELGYVVNGYVVETQTFTYGYQNYDCNTLPGQAILFNQQFVPAYVKGAVDTLNNTLIYFRIMSFCNGLTPY